MNMDTDTDVLILGGGIAGLSTAYRLQQKDIKTLVIEKNKVVGGRARSMGVNGLCTELSASALTSFYDRTLALLGSLDLTDQLTVIKEKEVFVKGDKEFHIAPLPLIFGGLLPWRSKFKLFLLSLDTLLHLRQLDEDDILTPYVLELDDESITDFVKRDLDDTSLLSNFIEPSFRAIYFWDTSRTSKVFLYLDLKYVRAMKSFHLKGGIGGIASALTAQLDIQPRLNCKAVQATYDHPSHIWKTTVSQQDTEGTKQRTEIIKSKAILCTLPATQINEVFQELDQSLKCFFSGITYVSNTTVHLFLKRRLINIPHYTYCPCEVKTIATVSIRSNGVSAETLPGTDVISVFPSSDFSKELAQKNDEQIEEDILSELNNLYPFNKKLKLTREDLILPSKIVRVQQALPEFPANYFNKLKSFQDCLSKKLPPGLFFAGDFLQTPCIEGAVVSGEKVLPDIKDFLRSQQGQ